MGKISLLVLIFAMLGLTATAQFKVQGLVADSAGVSEPYATVRIYNQKDSIKAIKLGVTDADGRFKQELPMAGKYRLSITSVGKSPIIKKFELTNDAKTKDFGTLIIKNSATTLAAVEVTAQKPLVTSQIDRLTYDVQSDEESKTNTALEMLRKVPMVTVDGQDNIKVKGSSNFKIYKNGRPDNTLSGNAKDVLKAIPANMIKKIEVITEPGAKYDAEGVNGILNIVMMENSSIKGVMGTANLGVSSRGVNDNIYLMTQIGKFTTSINYGYNHMSESGTKNYNTNETEYVSSGNKSYGYSRGVNPGNIHYGNIEASYDIDSLNLVTFSFGGYFYKLNVTSNQTLNMKDAKGNTLYSYDFLFTSPKYQYFDFNGQLDYQHLTKRKGESLVFSYLLSTTNQTRIEEEQYSNLFQFPVTYTDMNSDSRLKFYEHTFQFDWTRPIADKQKLEFGVKYINRNNDSKAIKEYNNGQTIPTDFNHLTQVAAAYGEYAYNTKRWGARAGLRYEYSYLSAKYADKPEDNFHMNLNDVVPTVSLSYQINDQNQLKLNFATRINRPGILYLNPAVNKTPTEISYGNPNLKCSRNNSLSLTYSLLKQKITINSSLNYTFNNNDITEYSYVKDNIINSTYENIGKVNKVNLNTYLQWQISRKTSFMINGSAFYTDFRNKNLGLELNRWGFDFYANATQTLPYKLKLSLAGGRNDGGVYSLYQYGGHSYFYFITLMKSFLKEDRLTVRLSAMNPFNNKYNNWNSWTVNGDTRAFSENKYLARSFNISISYRFGKLNAQVKKANKTIENDDLQGRK